MLKLKIGIIMDPIQNIDFKKDTSLALLLAAQQRGWELWYMEQQDLFIRQGRVYAWARPLTVKNDAAGWYSLPEFSAPTAIELSALDVILMRKDPPVDRLFIHTTQLLELVELSGTLVINRPRALRDYNEKLFVSWFPQCCPPHLVTSNMQQLLEFAQEHGQMVLKELDSFGGAAVHKIDYASGDVVNNRVIATATVQGTQPVMAQRYIPEIIKSGDKRILLINGKPFPYALARIPANGDFRGNLAVGAAGVGVKLTERDYWLCAEVGPLLQAKGLVFVGLDVIGDYITEINITSPTCVREIYQEHGVDASEELLNCIEQLKNKGDADEHV